MVWLSPAGPANVHQSNINHDHASPAKLANDISQRFKKDDRLTGKLGENILEYF